MFDFIAKQLKQDQNIDTTFKSLLDYIINTK